MTKKCKYKAIHLKRNLERVHWCKKMSSQCISVDNPKNCTLINIIKEIKNV